jgi:NAD(P)-dependent dehydrogenase (short-subunit alcohol dehydrogenase family)
MVQTAVDAFGDLHAVINNAAVERSRALVAMTEDEFDDVVAVKLKGAFAVTRWAARYWRDRAAAGDRTDRAVVNTTSGSGLLNPLPGQSNYAAANAAVAALTVVHALELRRFGVRVNALSPSMVRTRLTEGVPGMEAAGPGPDPRDPAVCAPVAAYLAAPGCPLTGQVLSVRGSTVAVNHGWSLGQHVTKDEGAWTVEELARALPALEHRDPFDALAAALGGALGAGGRADVERLIDTMLDTALDTALDGAR